MLASCENAEEAHIQGRSSVRLGEFYLKISWSHLLTFSHTSLMGNRAMQGSGSEFGGSLCFGNALATSPASPTWASDEPTGTGSGIYRDLRYVAVVMTETQ